MGKPTKASHVADLLANHYKGVQFTIDFEATGNGTNCKIKVNKTQAAAGVSFNKSKGEATPSKEECSKVADVAHNIATHKYASDYPDKTVPKKISGEELRGG